MTDSCDTPEAIEVRQILNRVGDKWSILVIAMLDQGTRRFSELRREVEGISQRMLALTLRQLERDGLVERTVYPVVPPKVEYRAHRPGFDAARVGPWSGELGDRASWSSGCGESRV